MNVFLDLCLFFRIFLLLLSSCIPTQLQAVVFMLFLLGNLLIETKWSITQRFNKRFYKINFLRLARKRVLFGREYDQYTQQSKAATYSRHPVTVNIYTRYCRSQNMSAHTYAFYSEFYVTNIHLGFKNARIFNYLKMIRVRDTKYFFVGQIVSRGTFNSKPKYIGHRLGL